MILSERDEQMRAEGRAEGRMYASKRRLYEAWIRLHDAEMRLCDAKVAMDEIKQHEVATQALKEKY
jgi:hypothetical protein